MEKEENPPVQQSVYVDCPAEEAFRLFTEGFAEWWPLAAYSVTGEESDNCAIEPWMGGRVFERTRSGKEYEWGSVIAWDPPRRLEFTWNPDMLHDNQEVVAVEFHVEGDGTRVTLTHRGWQLPGIVNCTQAGLGALPCDALVLFCKFVAAQMIAIG